MKKYSIIIALVLFLIISSVSILLLKNKSVIENQKEVSQPIQSAQTKEQSDAQKIRKIDYHKAFKGMLNPCEIFPKEKIENILGQKFVKVEFKQMPASKFTLYSCYYYQEPAKYNEHGVNMAKRISIHLRKGDINIGSNYGIIGFQVKEDQNIPFPHRLVYDQKGNFHHLDLILDEDLLLSVETWWSLLTEEEGLKFIKNFVSYFKSLVETQ